MTHTLHPEIEEAIDKIKKEYDDYEVGEYDEGDYGYSRGLLRSIQILKDIPLLNDKEPLPESKLLGTDFSKEDDIGCEIYGYVKDNRTVITKVNYVTPYVEEEQKQSTPKIEIIKQLEACVDATLYNFEEGLQDRQHCIVHINKLLSIAYDKGYNSLQS